MASSGTYTFAPSNSDVVIGAYGRVQIRRAELQIAHLVDAAREANLLMVEWSNKQPNLWVSEEISAELLDGTATYALPASTIMVLSCVIRTGEDATQTDRIVMPVSQYEYASFPNKNAEGFPSVFWFNRQITPEMTFWAVPDADDTYTAVIQVVRQMQDINLASGETPDLPYRWLDAFEAGLAHRLARIYKPELEDRRKNDAMEAWAIAATQDVENVPLAIVPGLSGYYR
jgi:hypothetical protein